MARAIRALLLGWRLERAELAAVGVVAIGLSVIAIGIARHLDLIVARCRVVGYGVAPCGGLRELGQVYDASTNTQMWLTVQLLAVLPFVAGLVLGAPLVARELEQRTALVAWPMAVSRVRWLARRVVPIALLGSIVLAVPAMAGEILVRSMYPLLDPATNFEGYGIRGPLLELRFVLALAISVLVGTLVGRQLPAVLVAGALVAGAGIGLEQLQPLWVEPVEQAAAQHPIDHVGSQFVRQRYRDANGAWMRDEDAWALLVTANEDQPQTGLPEEVMFVIPRERYGDVVLRESAALVAVIGGVSLALIRLLQRKRPG